MQTHGFRPGPTPALGAFARACRRLVAGLLAGATLLALGGCTAPSLETQVDQAGRPSECQVAYERASSLSASAGMTGISEASEGSDADTAPAGLPVMPRLMAAKAAASQWVDVAAACPARFDEGALRSAQARALAVSLARKLGAETMAQDMAADLADVDFSQVFRLTISGDGLAAMSLAEDQAGFAVETLAARDVAGATLALADDHKAAAQRLFTLSGVDKDPRQKLYDLTGLIAPPETTRDETTGLRTPTLALVEMSVARAYLRATDASDSDAPSAKTLRLMAESIARRAGLALTLGYPAFDAALFT